MKDERPRGAIPRFSPYNYVFADNLPDPIPQMIGEIASGNAALAPSFCNTMLAVTDTGLTVGGNRSMWVRRTTS